MTSPNFTNIETLTSSNFKKLKQDVEIVLDLMNIDLALREDQHAALTIASTVDQRNTYEKWERDNMMSLKIMKKAMKELGSSPDSFLGDPRD